MKRLVVLTGAGMSAESGIPTFRGSDGLWENHRIEDVATPQAWRKDPKLVLEFYNQRRKRILEAQPNRGHISLAELQEYFEVIIVTQNIDDLHERAGSRNVLHLHGEIRLARSTFDPSLLYPIDGWELKWGQKCERGSQLRPHIVWFGEEVPMLSSAADLVQTADHLLVVGTSLQVYPAASLVHYIRPGATGTVIDPEPPALISSWNHIRSGAAEGIDLWRRQHAAWDIV